MKKIAIIGFAVIIITACHKLENPFEKKHKDKPCATVASETVPQNVRDSFVHKYPNANVTTWFNKDNNGYSVVFTQNGSQVVAQFGNDGTFVKEEGDNNQQGEHHGNNNDNGCGCELESGD